VISSNAVGEAVLFRIARKVGTQPTQSLGDHLRLFRRRTGV